VGLTTEIAWSLAVVPEVCDSSFGARLWELKVSKAPIPAAINLIVAVAVAVAG
jgi:hypothetical protein